MNNRSAELTTFLMSLHEAITERAESDRVERQVIEKIMTALRIEQPQASVKQVWLPVCGLLDEAVKNVMTNVTEKGHNQLTASNLMDHARAILALAPQLAWWHRTIDVEPGSPMATGHANAIVIGLSLIHI